MGSGLLPEHLWFHEYRKDILDPKPRIRQLSYLDDEILNIEYVGHYGNELDPNEWDKLEEHYNELFRDFISDRVQAATHFDENRINEAEFAEFRRNISSLNRELPFMPGRSVTTISKPAERLLTKELRKQRYDPSALDVPHISRGGGLYLLELFVTAGRQDAESDTEMLETLLDEAARLQQHDEKSVRRLLNYPVLMVSLWENQRDGLDAWLDSDREGILEMATATGKTVAGIAAIADLCGNIPDRPEQSQRTDDANIMVVAHSNAILSQWAAEIGEKLGFSASSVTGSGKPDSVSFSEGEIEFYTAQSLLPHYDPDLKQSYDLVIYDEVHHYSNEEGYGAAIQRPNYDAALGLSATVGEEAGTKRETIEELLAPVIFKYDLEDASRDGIIPDFEWTVHPAKLSPRENSEWEETTESISNTFTHGVQGTSETQEILRELSVPFVEMNDLGDFIQAYQAAGLELDRDLPDEWEQLQALIQSRNWIRHRSQPKFEAGVDLAKSYLADGDDGPKIVMFAMDIDTTEKIADELSKVCDNVFTVHSKIASSTRKKDRLVNERIDSFANVDKGVLIAPKLLDEGIDVPDAEVGINVAGTKTKLQLVQRMGRVLRRHGDQRPHFHHFIAVPHKHELSGLDEKQYVQRRNWVRELGEAIGEQPIIKDAEVDMNVVERANQRGNELWARDLLADLEVETVKGTVKLEELIKEISLDAAKTLKQSLDLQSEEVDEDEWENVMTTLREDSETTIETLQRIWWLFPLYRRRPSELEQLLTKIIETHPDADRDDESASNTASRRGDKVSSEPTTLTEKNSMPTETPSGQRSDQDPARDISDHSSSTPRESQSGAGSRADDKGVDAQQDTDASDQTDDPETLMDRIKSVLE